MTQPRLIRTKTGAADDTVYADGATVPAEADTVGFSSGPLAGRPFTALEVFVVPVDAAGAAQARGANTFSLRVSHVVSRDSGEGPGDDWPEVAADTAVIEGVAFQQLVRVPLNGGRTFVGLEAISAPAGATAFQIWGKPVAE